MLTPEEIKHIHNIDYKRIEEDKDYEEMISDIIDEMRIISKDPKDKQYDEAIFYLRNIGNMFTISRNHELLKEAISYIESFKNLDYEIVIGEVFKMLKKKYNFDNIQDVVRFFKQISIDGNNVEIYPFLIKAVAIVYKKQLDDVYGDILKFLPKK